MTTATAALDGEPALADARKGRIGQLFACTLAVMMVSGPQYVWTLFVHPLRDQLAASLPLVQIAFSVFVIVQCGTGPFQGWFSDRVGPRLAVIAGALLMGISWIASAFAHSILTLCLTYGLIGGVGAGTVIVATLSNAAKWFPDRRGFAIGTVSGGYGMGAIVITAPAAAAIASHGYQWTLMVFGALTALACCLAALFIRPAPDALVKAAADVASASDRPMLGPKAMMKTPIFWLMFAMMVMMSGGGLLAVSQMGPLSEDFGVSKTLVLGMAALPLALSFDRICNGLTRPAFGWLSDQIGRELTMVIAFTIEAAAILVLLNLGRHPVAFVLMSGVVFFAWGEIFSLFPALQNDLFGAKYAAGNYGTLVMAQGLGSIIGGPLAALLHDRAGSWAPAFHIVVGMDLLTAALAWFALRPMRVAYMARTGAEAAARAA